MFRTRKTIRLEYSLYQVPDQPFSITICTINNQPIFKNRAYAEPIFDSILSGPLRAGADLMAACLMPDHLHLLIASTSTNLIKLIGSWKSFSTNLLAKHGFTAKIWQRSFYDHALRKEETIEVVANYIVDNPVRAGIVEKWQDYQYSWHKWM